MSEGVGPGLTVQEIAGERVVTGSAAQPQAAKFGGVGQFADPFMSADPGGVTMVPKAAFLAALPAREKLFASVGATGMRLTGITETPLDDHYILVDTRWETEPATGDTEPLSLSSAYILRRTEDHRLQVVFYLNHQDLAEVIRTAQ
jgi:hypothetical protein